MNIGNQPAQKPTLHHLIGADNPTLSIFLRGHLVLESLMNQMILTKKLKTVQGLEQMNCSKKISLLYTENLLSENFNKYLVNVNKLRNKFAHRLGYDLTKTDVYELINLAGNSPEVDFSDDMHSLHPDTLYEWYGNTTGVLEEMFKHVAMDMGFMLMDLGGDFPFEN